MARDLKAKIRLEADTQQADKALKNSTRELTRMEKASNSLGSAFSKLGPAFKTLSVAALAGAAAFAKIISLTNEQEDAVRKLDAAIGNLNGANQALSTALQAQADSLSQVTSASDEEILAVQQRIALFVKEEEQIKALTVASIDFAAAKGKNATEVADALVRSIVTENNALLEQGIIITGAAGSTERFDTALQGLSVTQGTAAALAQTTAGRIKNLSDAFGDLLQAIGGVVTKQEGFNGIIDRATVSLRKFAKELSFTLFKLDNYLLALGAGAEQVLPNWLARGLALEGNLAELNRLWFEQVKILEEEQKALDKASESARVLEREARLNAEAAAEFNRRSNDLTVTLEEQAPAFELVTQEATDYGLQLEEARERANLLIREEERLTAAVVSGAQARAAARSQERAGLQGSGEGGGLIDLSINLPRFGTFFTPAPVRGGANGRVESGP